MKEKILNVFKSLGFVMDDLDDGYYGFHYEGRTYIYINIEDDEDYLLVTVPAVVEPEGKDDMDYYRIMDNVNSSLKYVKANEVHGNMWLVYEYDLEGCDDLRSIILKVISRLEAAVGYVRKIMSVPDGDGLDTIDETCHEDNDE